MGPREDTCAGRRRIAKPVIGAARRQHRCLDCDGWDETIVTLARHALASDPSPMMVTAKLTGNTERFRGVEPKARRVISRTFMFRLSTRA